MIVQNNLLFYQKLKEMMWAITRNKTFIGVSVVSRLSFSWSCNIVCVGETPATKLLECPWIASSTCAEFNLEVSKYNSCMLYGIQGRQIYPTIVHEYSQSSTSCLMGENESAFRFIHIWILILLLLTRTTKKDQQPIAVQKSSEILMVTTTT